MRDAISKTDVKLAVKEAMKEQKLEQKYLRRMIQEEILKAKQKEEDKRKSTSVEKSLCEITKYYLKHKKIILWHILQSILMYFIVICFEIFDSIGNTFWEEIKCRGWNNVGGMLFAMVPILVIVFVVFFLSCFAEMRLYDKVKLFNPKFAKVVLIIIIIYFFSFSTSGSIVIKLLSLF